MFLFIWAKKSMVKIIRWRWGKVSILELCSLNLLHGKQKENEATKSAALLLDLVPQYPASKGYSLAWLSAFTSIQAICITCQLLSWFVYTPGETFLSVWKQTIYTTDIRHKWLVINTKSHAREKHLLFFFTKPWKRAFKILLSLYFEFQFQAF